MDAKTLTELGLNKAQSKVYLTLVQKGELTPPEVAEASGESRTNAYMVLDKLEELGLVEKGQNAQKVSYRPSNPVALEQLIDTRRKDLATLEQKIKATMPALLSYFYSFTEKPGVRLFEGKEGLKEIYKDTLRAKQDILVVRTTADRGSLGPEFYETYKKERARHGINTFIFSPSTKYVHQDEELNKQRVFLPEDDYNAPVEINVYGDRVAYMSHGEEIMGVIIQSPAIAESMRQILQMLASSLQAKS